jgi:hypothetical protein
MKREEIDEILKDCEPWKKAASWQKRAFTERMANRQYGRGPLTAAWWWYIMGVEDALR